MNDNPLQTYRSLEEIRMRKEMLRREIQKDNGQIKSTWDGLFHTEKATTPSKRMSGFMHPIQTNVRIHVNRRRSDGRHHPGMETLSEILQRKKDKKQEERRTFRILQKVADGPERLPNGELRHTRREALLYKRCVAEEYRLHIFY